MLNRHPVTGTNTDRFPVPQTVPKLCPNIPNDPSQNRMEQYRQVR